MLRSLLGLFTREGRAELKRMKEMRTLMNKYHREGVRYPAIRAYAETHGYMTNGNLHAKEDK
jgi:hypothetical protein